MSKLMEYAIGGVFALLVAYTAAEFIRTSFETAARNIKEAGMHN